MCCLTDINLVNSESVHYHQRNLQYHYLNHMILDFKENCFYFDVLLVRWEENEYCLSWQQSFSPWSHPRQLVYLICHCSKGLKSWIKYCCNKDDGMNPIWQFWYHIEHFCWILVWNTHPNINKSNQPKNY